MIRFSYYVAVVIRMTLWFWLISLSAPSVNTATTVLLVLLVLCIEANTFTIERFRGFFGEIVKAIKTLSGQG